MTQEKKKLEEEGEERGCVQVINGEESTINEGKEKASLPNGHVRRSIFWLWFVFWSIRNSDLKCLSLHPISSWTETLSVEL